MQVFLTPAFQPRAIGRAGMFGSGPHLVWSTPKRLAQAVSNRLLDLPVGRILGRRSVATISAFKVGPARLSIPPNWPYLTEAELNTPMNVGWPTASDQVALAMEWPASVVYALMTASISPTHEEVDDADVIDEFFGGQSTRFVSSMARGEPPDPWLFEVCATGALSIRCQQGSRDCRQVKGGFFARAVEFDLNEFWCPPWAKSGNYESPELPLIMIYEMPAFGAWESVRGAFWGLTGGELWKDVRPWLPNAMAAEEVLKDYPFPQPFNEYVMYWTRFGLAGLRGLVKVPVELLREDIRAWITFSILANYETMVNTLNSDLKDKAKRKKRKMQLVTYAVAAFGVVLLAAGLPAIIGAVMSAASSSLQKIDMAKFNREMGEIADAFGETDPAFSSEITSAAGYVENLSAGLETGISVEESRRSALPTTLLVGGAAVGAIGLALLLGR
jgi:hypothetical protein